MAPTIPGVHEDEKRLDTELWACTPSSLIRRSRDAFPPYILQALGEFCNADGLAVVSCGLAKMLLVRIAVAVIFTIFFLVKVRVAAKPLRVRC